MAQGRKDDTGKTDQKRGSLFRDLWADTVDARLESEPSLKGTGESKRKREGMGRKVKPSGLCFTSEV